MNTLANDFVNLPIIISDYDALLKPSDTPTSTSASQHQRKPSIPNITASSLTVSSSAASVTSSASTQRWGTGFSEYADELWSRMTSGMKQKLKDACVEVLKRIDDPSEEERVAWVFDDDARFLD